MKPLVKMIVNSLALVGGLQLWQEYTSRKNARTPGSEDWDRRHPAPGYESPR